jgi:hypothetical protein
MRRKIIEVSLSAILLTALVLYVVFVIRPIDECPATVKIANLRMAGCP